jgi:hypothetical protein
MPPKSKSVTTPKGAKRKQPITRTPPKKKPKTVKPLTSDEIRLAQRQNPPDCYVVGPKNGSWVDNAKAMAAYLGFEELEGFRAWFKRKRTVPNTPTPEEILEAFRTIAEGNFGKPNKFGGSNRTNVSRHSIWEQLNNNTLELMPQMQKDSAYVRRLKSDHPAHR